MKLIEQEDKEAFFKVLEQFNLPAEDFDLIETDTTDPKSDEILALTGFVVITRKSTNQSVEYPIGVSTSWTERFEMDISKNVFGS
jgi:hypothetical protein